MKKLTKTAIAIALSLTATFTMLNKARANDTITSIHLAQGSETSFENFMEKNGKSFLKRNNDVWATFNQTVALYNNSSGRFLNLSEVQKSEFLNASAVIKAKLTKMKAQDWLEKVNVTEKVFAYIWDQKVEQKPMKEILELPALKAERALGR